MSLEGGGVGLGWVGLGWVGLGWRRLLSPAARAWAVPMGPGEGSLRFAGDLDGDRDCHLTVFLRFRALL